MGYIIRPLRTDLTNREKEIAKLLIKGYSNTQMALELNISKHTVKRHVSSILIKLDALNRTHAAYILGQMNLD